MINQILTIVSQAFGFQKIESCIWGKVPSDFRKTALVEVALEAQGGLPDKKSEKRNYFFLFGCAGDNEKSPVVQLACRNS